MHFSVTDTQDLADSSGNPYLGYNMHINGLFHCTVRYKQLHNLHEQLVKELDVPLPTFPPKKFFPLTPNQQEERRQSLDKYIQTIGQNTNINNSELLNGFLLTAQLESAPSTIQSERIDVFLMDGTKISLQVTGAENSFQILKKLLKQMQVNEKLCSYFSLFIILQNEESFYVLRKLQGFESPIIAQRNMNKLDTRIAIGKWYWDIEFDNELLSDSVAADILFAQTFSEVERGWILTTKDNQCQLNALKDKNDKKEYLKIARSLKYYGYMQFAPSICDYPQPGSKVLVSIGKNELNIRIASTENDFEEVGFKVTRMRCWRITTLQEGNDKNEENVGSNLELSFEYLMAKDHLQWITISSNQSILMSICLQSMIDELLFKTVGGTKIKELTEKMWTYVTKDGHSRTIMGPLSLEVFNKNIKENDVNGRHKTEPILKKITERLSAVKVRKNHVKSSDLDQERKYHASTDLLENNAFGIIGDDDL